MPPKQKTKRSQYAFQFKFINSRCRTMKLLDIGWHNALCCSTQHGSESLELYIHKQWFIDTRIGPHSIAQYRCTSKYCRNAVHLCICSNTNIGVGKEEERLKHCITGCTRTWRKFKLRRRLSVRTILSHCLHIPSSITDIVSEYIDSGATQPTGKRLQENIALPIAV